MVWTDQNIGLALAISSSVFIGSSFIIKKRGLRLAGASGLRAGAGGFSYLREPVWWAGLLSMVVGEVANFSAYAFAPAVLVTPLGALSIIVSAVLAHHLLNERLNLFGILGCVLCINGSITIVLHAPPEREVASVLEVWDLAMQPGFVAYALAALAAILYLIWVVAPAHGTTNIFVYTSICSLAGSLSVTSCKALGIALKLTFGGDNQLVHLPTYVFVAFVASCIVTQMNYLNKALDLFNTAIVSPIYYVLFTTLSIAASVIMFRDIQSWLQLATEACGFITIVGGTFLLHTTRDLDLTVGDLDELTKEGGGAGGADDGAGGATGSGARSSTSGRVRGRRQGGGDAGGGGGGGKHLAVEVVQLGGGGAGGAGGDDAREDEPLLSSGTAANGRGGGGNKGAPRVSAV